MTSADAKRTLSAPIVGLAAGLIVALGAIYWAVEAADIAQQAARPHVVLVSLDTLRAGNLGCYGHERDTSPHLDDLARRSVRFENAFAQASVTLASHLSLLTSLYPPQFGIVRDDGQNYMQNVTKLRLSDNVVTLAEVLADAGYSTAAFAGGGLVSRSYGFAQGFDHFWNASTPAENTLAESLPRLFDWLDAWQDDHDADERVFVFLHSYDIHDPYRAPAPFKKAFTDRRAEQFVRQEKYAPITTALQAHLPDPTPEQLAEIMGFYDNGIAYADDRMAALEQGLRERGLWENTLLVILSDHGEEFMEHGDWGHRPKIFRELTHVPLIVHFPEDDHAGTVVESPVELLDVAPTILEWLELPPPSDWRGQSLMPFVQGRANPTPNRPIYSEVANERFAIRGVRRGDWLLVWHGAADRTELYDLANDPGEQHDVAAEHQDVVAEMFGDLKSWMEELLRSSEQLQAVPMDADGLSLMEFEQEVLRQLGYVK
jgi:arylsulfatase A-like enzyme